jgi:hypothetical protein
MVTDVKRRQSLKADSPIDVIELGMVTDVILWHELKAQFPIEVTPSLITTAAMEPTGHGAAYI